MTVKELIELNQMITDVQITVRLQGRLLDQLNIGCAEGVKPRFPVRVPKDERWLGNMETWSDHSHKDAEYMPVSINAWDDGKDYWQVKVDRIPKEWRELEVYGWDSHPASTVGTTSPRRGRTHFSGERIRIKALASGGSLRAEEKPKQAETEQLEGQLAFTDINGTIKEEE